MCAWVARFRRLARDYERLPTVLAGLHKLSHILCGHRALVAEAGGGAAAPRGLRPDSDAIRRKLGRSSRRTREPFVTIDPLNVTAT